METRIETITPDIAKSMLETNTSNRKVRHAHVRWLADQIIKGRWLTTHQGICFNTYGILQDGQHRLMACVMANMPIKVLVTRGAMIENNLGIDNGEARNIADLLSVPNKIAIPASFIARFTLAIGSKLSARDVEPFIEEFRYDFEALLDVCGSTAKFFSTAPIQSAAVIAGRLSDRNYAYSQYRALVLADFDLMSTATKALYRQFLSTGITKRKSNHIIFIKAAYVFDKKNMNMNYLGFRDPDTKLKMMRDEILAMVPSISRSDIKSSIPARAAIKRSKYIAESIGF